MAWVEIGDIRFKTKFLWLPKTIGIKTCWLKTASWEEEYRGSGWVPLRWIGPWDNHKGRKQ